MHINQFVSSVIVDLESNLVHPTQDNEIVVHAQELGFCDTQFHEKKNKDCNSTLILSNDPETLVIEDTVEEEFKILDLAIECTNDDSIIDITFYSSHDQWHFDRIQSKSFKNEGHISVQSGLYLNRHEEDH